MVRVSQLLKIFCFVLLAVCILGSGIVFADDAEDEFDKKLEKLSKEGVVSSMNGTKTSYGDYTDEWAQIGWYQWTHFEEAERFVLSAKVSWDSAYDKPNNFESGCGVIFNEGNGNSNHILMSIRMDGLIYFTGIRGGRYLSYGTYKYGRPSIKGSVDLTLVVTSDRATVYLNGERIVRKADLPMMGDGVGLCTLSGTNRDFGTRCKWEDIYFYEW